VSGGDVVAVGLTGQMHGAVLLDRAGEVLRPAILWNDQRTGAECDAIRQALGPERLIAMRLVPFGPNRPERFYRGGEMIAAFRGRTEVEGDNHPEDWLASTTTLFGQPRLGLTSLNGRLLRDWIASEPEEWLGPAHTAIFGPDPAMLVKLLAPGERLPIHAHPDRTFARHHLGARWGKTEAWCVLRVANGEGEAYLGWREPIERDILASRVAAQDMASLLALMNKVRVVPGDTILVPAGTAHAIGRGMLLLELQEPSDFSVLLEWDGFGIDGSKDGHLGLGFGTALSAVSADATSASRLEALIVRSGSKAPTKTRILPPEADSFFRADHIGDSDTETLQPPGLAILVITAGQGQVTTECDEIVSVHAGMTIAVPYGAGSWRLRGEVDSICCRPPLAYELGS
jgi:mannose-6-phosphate isomerase